MHEDGKIGVCAAVFTFCIWLGAMAHDHVATKEKNAGLKRYETHADDAIGHPPFAAREYVRIVRTAAHNARAHADAAKRERPGRMQWSEMQRLYEGVFVLSATREQRKVALTFDDVPDPIYASGARRVKAKTCQSDVLHRRNAREQAPGPCASHTPGRACDRQSLVFASGFVSRFLAGDD